MTDIDALITETKDLRDRWAKLDTELTGKLREFSSWMREKFPTTSTPSPHKYNPPTRHVPAAHNLYPTPLPHEAWITLSIESPTEHESFAFICDDDLSNGKDWYYLPFAWLQDPEGFFQALLTRVSMRQSGRLRARLRCCAPRKPTACGPGWPS